MAAPALTAKDIFDHALELKNSAERKSYLDQACSEDLELRRKVEALLQAYEDAGSLFLKRPALPLDMTGPYQPASETPDQQGALPDTVDGQAESTSQPIQEDLGTHIGPYKLVKKLGQGGMGTVYLAQQERPIRRQVALKIIKPGMDITRFQAERQALTMMDHVNIARVFDAGTTEDGQPYFIMELVAGKPMSQFCNKNALTLRERLTLFVSVCDAIQHAHQKGVIHRDIKPSNVLIAMQEGRPVAKVIDFGLAKATEEKLTDQSQLTQFGSIVGTWKYMSPEQADVSEQGIDTRTDIYSLGVMLYELLTGTTPLDLAKTGPSLFDVIKSIREKEPPRPSIRLTELGDQLATIAAQRKTEPAKLLKLLRGELDWIVLKALEKSRDRRYQTASDFAKDIQRYLDDEPVEACPPSARYRLGKFTRKNRIPLLVLGGFIALLLLGIVVSTVGFVKAKQAQDQAEKAEGRTYDAFKIAWAGLNTRARSRTKPGEAEAAIMLRMLEGYGRLVELEPGASRHARTTAAETAFFVAGYAARIDVDRAETIYKKAIDLYESLSKDFPNEPDYRAQLARCDFDLAFLLNELEKTSDAEGGYRRCIQLLEQVIAECPSEAGYQRELADAYINLAVLLRDKIQKPDEAEKAVREAVIFGEKVRVLAPEVLSYRINLAASYHNLGNIVRDQGHAEAALEWYGKAITMLEPIQPLPQDANEYLRNAHWDRAHALGKLGRHADAIPDWQAAIELDRVKSPDPVQPPDRAYLSVFLAASQLEVKLKGEAKPGGALLYQGAILNAQATVAARDAQESGLQDLYAKRTLELLKQSQTAGWFRDPQAIKRLQDDKSFGDWLGEEFKLFLERLGAEKS